MRKYIIPEMIITSFSVENIVTGSVTEVEESNSILLEPHVGSGVQKHGSISYRDSQEPGSIFAFN